MVTNGCLTEQFTNSRKLQLQKSHRIKLVFSVLTTQPVLENTYTAQQNVEKSFFECTNSTRAVNLWRENFQLWLANFTATANTNFR